MKNNNLKNIKGIAFDFWGVFAKMKFPVEEYLLKNNIPLEKYSDEIYELVIKADLGELDSREYVKACSKLVGMELPYDKCRSVYRKELINEHLVDLVRQLKNNYKIALLTNNSSDCINAFIFNSDLDELFDHVITSYQVKHRKPAPEIYEAMIKEIGLEAGEILFVDDDKENIPQANTLGIKTHIYKWGENKLLEQLIV